MNGELKRCAAVVECREEINALNTRDEVDLAKDEKVAWRYQLRESRRARHYRIVIKSNKHVEVVYPHSGSVKQALAFLSSQQQWVNDKIREAPCEPTTLLPTQLSFPCLGERWEVVSLPRADSARVRLLEASGSSLRLYFPEGQEPRAVMRLQQWLKQHAQASLSGRVHELSQQTGLAFSRLTFRWQRSRWGSCSSGGAISLNAKLLFFRQDLVDYVILHELCHLRYFDHSPAFWRLLTQFDPRARQHDKALGQEAKKVPFLHRSF